MKKALSIAILIMASLTAGAQVKIAVHETRPGAVIPAEIYGQFSEHLGRCIYDGIWVGPESDIPNQDGYRTDVLEALKALKVPVLRWPGGCFADEYHWRDGIGPRENRPKMVNSNWGGTVEDNSFGTHEFLNLCELLGTKPYISGNVGSGTVEELAKWVEYMTADSGTMAELRAANGREKPWRVKYLGIGNETWGCGGNMTAQYYSDVFKRYGLYTRNYGGNRLFKVACGASGDDYEWTRTMMANARRHMDGLSVHYYTVDNWDDKGSATDFTPAEYYETITKTVEIDEILRNHIAIMDAFDPEKKVALILDEWGTWYNVEPETNPGHLFQQNTMRDAIVAGLNLNIFHKYTDRMKMANIAQIVNVLQSMILTKGREMVLTPTYHVFRMYSVHQNAEFIPTECECGDLFSERGRVMKDFSVSASRDSAGRLHISMVNPRLDKAQEVELSFDSLRPKAVRAEILSAPAINSFNEFGAAPAVAPLKFDGIRLRNGRLMLSLPPASIVVLEL